MNNRVIKILFSVIAVTTLMASILNATVPNPTVVDKTGRIIESTMRPTAETTIDPNTNDIAIKLKNRGITSSNDRTNNITSNGIIETEISDLATSSNTYTLIRHTNSIINIEDSNYRLYNDEKTGRIKILIEQNAEYGFYNDYIKDNFVKIDGKIYYFDKDGIMVLGNAYDTIGNYFYFEPSTGELINEIQKKDP